MPQAALREALPSSEANMLKLEEYPIRAASAFRKYICAADIEKYKNFLKMMYYYTLDSENKLEYAAKKSHEKELKDYYLQMRKEETNHFLLARKDYEGFGGVIDENYKPPVVKAFDDFWYGLGKSDPAEFAAALFVFESIADHVRDDIKDMLNRLQITGKQSRWLRVHVEADEEHGAEAHEVCAKYIARNPDALLKASEVACERWIAVFEEALS